MGFGRFDISVWKEIQDKFSKEIGLPVCTINSAGEEIAVSGEFSFLCQMVRKKGNEICRKQRIETLEKIKSGNKGVIYQCKAGLFNLMVPVFDCNEMIGEVVCSGIRLTDYFDYGALGNKIDVGKDELLDAFSAVSMRSRNELKEYARLLSVFLSIVPDVAARKRESDDKISDLTVMYKLLRLINSTLELDELINYAIKFIARFLKADECSVQMFENGKRYSLRGKGDAALEKEICRKVIERKSLVIQENDVNSVIAFPLKIREEVIGIIYVYGELVGGIRRKEIGFVSVIADQIAIGISNASQYEQIRQLAIVDKLTGVFNRRHFMELLDREIVRSESFDKPISIILIDIDDFGKYNNANGHLKGDKLLREIGGLLRENIRGVDVVGRYGGEEFIVLLPEASVVEAFEIAERIRRKVEEQKFDGMEKQPNGKITISVGVVSCKDKNIGKDGLIKEADISLYKAKQQGKNQIVKTVVIANNLKADV